MSRPVPLTALKTFEVAARLLSFKRAAQELNVTPTAVSHQIQNLEEMLGTKLFRRLPSGLELTSAGEVALPSLRDGFGKLREAVELIGSAGAGDVLTVLAPPSFAMRWLMPRLHRFAIRHPRIDVRVSTRMRQFGYRTLGGTRATDSGTLQSWCEELDVVVTFGTGNYAGLAVTSLFPVTITPLCAPERLPASGMNTIDIARIPLLHDDRGLMYDQRSYWDIWVQAQSLTGIDTTEGMHFSHSILALEAAAEGLGITVTTPALAREALATGKLVAPFSLEVPLHYGYDLVSNENVARREAVEAFRVWAIEEARAERELNERIERRREY
ncbi:LysR substrate-binding domain-containing protein [Caballeronia sp. LZ008]|uniref:LysR substrate-binding domain-containing protein n=1 Tax=unclassified Caballeronia TaxID=2646786 RepID=UPI002027FAAE|nr:MULTISPECIES: LysR substrate-binding domain-containing protein [unclassified Caballeronia]MDR5798197.1 LysR substrate-binding domain-containing protein [Caballeronia sp. LZ008]